MTTITTIDHEPNLDSIKAVLNKAGQMRSAGQANRLIIFFFNGINIFVNNESDLALLYRDYNIAVRLGYKQVGPSSLAKVPQEIKAAFDTAIAADAASE